MHWLLIGQIAGTVIVVLALLYIIFLRNESADTVIAIVVGALGVCLTLICFTVGHFSKPIKGAVAPSVERQDTIAQHQK